MQPLITIVTVVLNDAEGFRKTARSVIAQDYPRLEFRVVDGGSTDGTLKELERFSGHISSWTSGPDAGIYDAMNKGALLAAGDWVLFLNAGDVLTGPSVLSEMFARDHGDAGIVYGDAIAAYPRFRVLQKAHTPVEGWKGMPFCHQSAFFRTGLVREFPFTSGYAIAGDFDQVYRILLQGIRYEYLPVPVSLYDASGVSNRRHLRSWRERFAVYWKNGPVSLHGLLFYSALFIIFAGTAAAYLLLPSKQIERLIRWREREGIAAAEKIMNTDTEAK
ncbi:MAG TPA: glycosyltransferase family 2 protein [Bacteroidales bacterium]|nr:glycosyltransferase family 2 protein [Bacteroidales bacterium]